MVYHTVTQFNWGRRYRRSRISRSGPLLMGFYALEQEYIPDVTESPSERENRTVHLSQEKSPNDPRVPYPTNQYRQSYITISSTTILGSRSVQIHRPRNSIIFNRFGPSAKEPFNWLIVPSLSSFHTRSDARSSLPRRGEYIS